MHSHSLRIAKFSQDIFYIFCAAMAVIVGCSVLWVIHPNFFWIDDMQSQHISAYIDMARAIGEGSFPLISPYSWNGGQLAGELQYGVFSIFQLSLSCVICNLPISMSSMAALFCVTYLLILSAGSYILGRSYRLPPYLNFLMATSLPFSGYLILWGTKSWFPILTSLAWLPWAWATLRWTMKEPDRPLTAICGGLLIYLVFSAGWPFTNLMLLLIGAWMITTKIFQTKSLPKIKYFILAWVIGLLLATPTIIMFIEAMKWSTRGHAWFHPQRAWMVPWPAFWGLFLPAYETFWMNFDVVWTPRFSAELFCGVAPPALLLLVLWKGKKSMFKKVLPEIFLLGILFLLTSLPTLTPLQHSFRWLPLFHLIFLLVVALLWNFYTTDENCIAQMKSEWKGVSRAYTLCASLTAIVTSLLFARVAVLKMIGTPPLRIASYSILGILCVWIVVSRLVSLRVNQWLISIVSLISLMISLAILPNPNLLPEWKIPEKIRAAYPYKQDSLYLALIDYNAIYRFYDLYPEDDRAILKFGNLPLASKVKFINGYSPTYPTGINFLFLFAWSGFTGPSTIREFVTHPELLDFLQIDGVLIPKKLYPSLALPPSWSRTYESANLSLYERAAPTPSARSVSQAILTPDAKQFIIQNKDNNRWSQCLIESPSLESQQTQTFAQANLTSIKETRLGVTADAQNSDPHRPALVIFKRAWYPGYRAFLNQQELHVYISNLCMPAVQLPPNASGKLSLQFRPIRLTQSLFAVSAGILLILGLGIRPAHTSVTDPKKRAKLSLRARGQLQYTFPRRL